MAKKAAKKTKGKSKKSAAGKAKKKVIKKAVKKKPARPKKKAAKKAVKKKVKKAAKKPVKKAVKKVARKPLRPKPVARPKPMPTPPPSPPPAPPVIAEERIGVVTHYYTHLGVAVVRLESGQLRPGDTIRIKGHSSDFTQAVESMEVNHQKVWQAIAGQEFGLKVVDHAREHDQVYKVAG